MSVLSLTSAFGLKSSLFSCTGRPYTFQVVVCVIRYDDDCVECAQTLTDLTYLQH